MFPERSREVDPAVVVVSSTTPLINGEKSYDYKTLLGEHYRVSPQTGREVFFVSMLENGIDVFPPKDGDGIIITKQAIQLCDNRVG